MLTTEDTEDTEAATSETDALDRFLHNPRVLQDRYSEMMEHAQNMERERDEAREELRTAVQERHDFHWELQDAIRERNEARELAQQMSESNQVLMADARFYRNAWEQRMEAAK